MDTAAPGGVKLVIDVPYSRLNMIQRPEHPGIIETALTIDVLISGPKNEKVLQKHETYPLSLQADALDKLAKYLTIEMPLTPAPPPGKYSAVVTVVNETDKSQASKKIVFSL